MKVEDIIMGPKKKITNDDCGSDDAEFDCRQGEVVYLLTETSRADLLWGPSQPLIRRITGLFLWTQFSPLSTSKLKNEWSYTSTPL